ncbi:MAG: hypothetical protein ISS72_09260, partial [Candidatus Brocadiae bacterium]|nr:hypothetical protein [Candidatus Brocadiia bacterium]
QLFADLRDMQDPNNFDLLSGFYTKLDPPHQERIVVLIGDIGDVRGVPTLIEALKSPDASVGRRAAHALAWAFPGAPGVTEAFGEALGRDHLAPEAARYLIKRRLTPELRGLAAVVETPLAQARRLTDAGETGAARAAYRSVLEDRDAPTTHRLQAARALLQDATPKERGDIRKAVLRMVPQERRSGDHGLAEQAAVTLRALRHPDCLQALLVLLQGQSTLDRAAMRITTMAVRELGAAARRKAAIQLIDTLAERAPGFGVARPSQSMLSLIWLADRDGYEQASMVMDEGHRRAWATLEPLRSLADCADEGTLLAELLSGKRPRKPQPEAPATATVSRTQLTNASVTVSWAGPGLPPEALEWIVFRLGDLRDRRAIQLLSHHMVKFASWQSGAAAAEALRTIGGPEVEASMTRLVFPDKPGYVPHYAVRVLLDVLDDRALPVARRMLAEAGFSQKRLALEEIGRSGTANDIAVVRPYCDYWTADRRLHREAMSAAAALRERHRHDLNGPIQTLDAR